jgi:hypothetical protein
MKTEALKMKGWNGRYYLTRKMKGDLTWWKEKIK